MSVDGHEYILTSGSCFVFAPGTTLRFCNREKPRLSVHLIEFERVNISRSGQDTAAAFPLYGEIPAVPNSRVMQLAKQLYENRQPEGELAQYANHVAFQELILLLMKAMDKGFEQTAIQAVRRTVEQLQEATSLQLTLSQLAEWAGLSPRHYSRIFHSLTGQSPIEYLISKRLEGAKRRLLDTDDSIQEIAISSGYKDPFHFSRSFKQHTGVSPRFYIQLRKQSVRIASLQFLGEMLALGIKPAGAPSQLLDCRYFSNQIEGIQEIGRSVVTPYWDKLSALKPDMIVTFNGHHYSDYTKIAPTLDISWSTPFFDRFRMIASALGKEQMAEEWVRKYLQEAEQIKSRLNPAVWEEGQTVSFFWMRGLPASFQAYFDMGVLYRDLGLAAPDAVVRMQKKRDHPFKADIPLKDLALYAGDHLFVVVSPDPESEAQFQRLVASPQWRGLKAVKNRRVYRVTEDWLREDPVSLMGQVRDTVKFLPFPKE